MSPESHQKVSDLFDQAAELPPDQWEAFLEANCGGDGEIRRRVLALLEAERHAPTTFLAQPAMHITAKQLVDRAAELSGTQLGPYRVGVQVGSGGMGTVYEAHDSRLDRKVAIKVLPPAFMGDPERVARFRQEARAASQLNHPNIVSVFDAELDHGHYYIATEFVQGQTLRKLTLERPLEFKQLIDIGIQICSALAAAHEAGIVHRDIKPENVMVRPDGVVKVLDFGLAKLYEPASGEQASSLHTRSGSIAGTVQYLSPEQILGHRTGPRSDIFSLGVVLYELACGGRPFTGATDGAIYAAILREPPPLPSTLRRNLDPDLESLILRALEKDPDLRFQTIGDLGSALRRLQRDSAFSMRPPVDRAPSRVALSRLPPWGIAAGALVVAVASFVLRPHASPPLPIAFERLTSGGEEISPSLSPDGRQVIFASRKSGNWDIYLKRVGGEAEINLTQGSVEDDTEPAFSPDGKFIAFRSGRSGGGLFIMEATGENPRRVSDKGFYPSWAPDGSQIVYSDCDFEVPSERRCFPSHLAILDLATQTSRPLPAVADGIQPAWSPHGHRIAYWGMPGDGGGRSIFTVDRAGRSVLQLAKVEGSGLDWNPVWSPAGDYLYFISGRGGTMNLWRLPVEETSGLARGEPEPVTTPAAYVRGVSMGRDGNQLVFTSSRMQVSLFAVELDPARAVVKGLPVAIGHGETSIADFSLSPDEKQLVFDTLTDSQENLWVMNVDGSGRRRLTTGSHKDRAPAWSPVSDQIAFYSDRGSTNADNYDVWVIRADGSGLRRVTALENESLQSPGWSPDGQKILIHPNQGHPALVDPAASMLKKAPDRLPGFEDYGFAYFPPWHIASNRWIGYAKTKRARRDILLFDPAAGTVEFTGANGEEPHLLPGGRQFLYYRGGRCFSYDLDRRQEREIFSVSPHVFFSFEITRDGRRLYFTQANRDGEVWLARMKKD